MDAAKLFVERCRQVEDLMKSNQQIDLLDLSAKLRQLLVDGSSTLANQANREQQLKLSFKVGEFTSEPDEYVVIQGLADGLDPGTRRPGLPIKELNLDGFLKHRVLYLKGHAYSVRDVIKHASDAAGGIHRDENPKDQHKKIAEYSGQWEIGGLPAAMQQLRAIARVTLKGLAPLREALTKELGGKDWRLLPVVDANGGIIVWDIYLRSAWMGSRRTQAQCLQCLRHVGATGG